jgi:hypothetical protein
MPDQRNDLVHGFSHLGLRGTLVCKCGYASMSDERFEAHVARLALRGGRLDA